MGDEVRTDASVVATDSRKRERADVDYRDLERVAEIVLVLSAMAEARGGRDPTTAERALMGEAREKLAKMCELLDHRKDLFTREMAMGVVLDHGLNPPKDNVPRPRKISIAEKVANTIKKMVEIKESLAQSSTTTAQHLPAVVRPESHGLFHVVHSFLPDAAKSVVSSAAGFQIASPGVPSLAPVASPMKQSQANEIQRGLSPMKSSSGPVEMSHFRFDSRPVGPSYVSQVQDKSTTVVQSTPASLMKPSEANKVHQASMRVEGSHGIYSVRDQDSKYSVIQAASGSFQRTHQPLMHPPSVLVPHTEIAKSVQKMLPPKALSQPSWTPPPTDYMSKPLSCQICKIIISDVESLLVCDACEKGAHLKCLLSYNQRGIPKVEWHCPKCMMSSNGKPFAPKYGRVTRNITTSRPSPNIGSVQASSEKRADNLDSKAKYLKIFPSENPATMNPLLASTVGSNQDSTTGTKTPNAEPPAADIPVTSTKENEPHEGTCTDHIDGRAAPTFVSSGQPNGSSNEHCFNSGLLPCEMQPSTADSNLHSILESENCSSTPVSCDVEINSHNQLQSDPQTVDNTEGSMSSEISADPLCEIDKNMVEELKKLSELGKTSSLETGCDTTGGVLVSSGETLDSRDGTRDCGKPFSADIDDAEWIGSALQSVDGRTYYQSCRIYGVVYKLLDHVLISSDKFNFLPSKLQAFFEDNKSKSKWATVNRCYFPSDLPDGFLRPSNPEYNEVYESNNESTIMVASINGTCQVLPPTKFKVESERRRLSGEAIIGLNPVFLCRWFYDERNGLFQSTTN